MFSPRNKRIFWVLLGLIFIISIFFIKTKSKFENEAAKNTGLVYNGNQKIGSFVDRDTDGDGVPDWEESLWGTDPTKVDTNGDGVPDGVDIAKRKGLDMNSYNSNTPTTIGENLTETEKFSRELFATVVSLNQTGALDKNTIDRLTSSLGQEIENFSTNKLFSISDINITEDNSIKAIKTYNDSLYNIFKKYPVIFKNGYDQITYVIDGNFSDTLQEYLDTEDTSVFSRLDPDIKAIQGLMDGMAKMPVPALLAKLHLAVLNDFGKLVDNLKNASLIEKDTILAMGAASKYQENSDALQRAIDRLRAIIDNKLK